MRRVSFVEAIVVAAFGAFLAGVMYHFGALVLGAYDAIRLVILSVGLGYAGFLLARSPRGDGRILALMLWLVLSGVTLMFDPSAMVYLFIQILMFWLIRALCHHRRLIHGLADGVICAISLASAPWALAATGSIAVACWSVLLCQSLFTLMPQKELAQALSAGHLSMRFDRACRGAEIALRRATRGS